MKSAMAIFLLLSSMISIADSSKAKGWRGLVPLHSTRADVERLLGPGTNECKCGYYLNDMNVFFVYSSGDCQSGGSGGWDIPPDTIIRFTVIPNPKPRLSDLNIDASKFKEEQAGPIKGRLNYYNEEEGLTLDVYEGIVQSFRYGPALPDKYLSCNSNNTDESNKYSAVPKQFRASLPEMLNQFVEYSRTKQYEKQYELFLPEIAAILFPVKSKEEYGRWVRNASPSQESWAEIQLNDVIEKEDDTYGKIYVLYVRAKTSEAGKIVESSRITEAIIKDQKWYLIRPFWLAPA